MKSKIDRVSDAEFTTIVKESSGVRAILGKLGYMSQSGSMHNKVKARIKKLGIDTSHMGSRLDSRNGRKKIPLFEILVENSDYASTYHLKHRLLDEKVIENKCNECGIEAEWNGKPLTLQLDHINGINNDHRIENLQMLCPNCHTQTKTYGSKNIGNYD